MSNGAASKQPQARATVAEGVLDLLERAGVRHIFGISGAVSIDFLDHLSRRPKLSYVSVRHKQVAGHMADGVGRAGGLGVVVVARGAGAANVSMATLSAFASDSPVLVIAIQPPTQNLLRDDFQVTDLVSVFRPFTKWAVEITSDEVAVECAARAIRIARSYRPGPVLVSVPQDVLQTTIESSTSTLEEVSPNRLPGIDPEAVEEAVELLTRAHRPVVLGGNGILASGASKALGACGDALLSGP